MRYDSLSNRLRSLRLVVRTLASHAGNRGSNPLGSAISPAPLPAASLAGAFRMLLRLYCRRPGIPIRLPCMMARPPGGDSTPGPGALPLFNRRNQSLRGKHKPRRAHPVSQQTRDTGWQTRTRLDRTGIMHPLNSKDLSLNEREHLDERAAILEFDAGWPRVIAESEAGRSVAQMRWQQSPPGNAGWILPPSLPGRITP